MLKKFVLFSSQNLRRAKNMQNDKCIRKFQNVKLYAILAKLNKLYKSKINLFIFLIHLNA